MAAIERNIPDSHGASMTTANLFANINDTTVGLQIIHFLVFIIILLCYF